MMLTDLAIAARKSGLKVVERPGWKTRGHGQMSGVKTIVAHHDVTPNNMVNGALEYIEREKLSQLTLARDGTVYVVAAGLCYHAGVVHETAQSNAWAIGIEAAHSGKSADPWPKVQYDAYVRLCRALAGHYKLPVSRVQGHKEVARPAGRKTDPTFNMNSFRAAVAVEEDDMPTAAEVAAAVWGSQIGRNETRRTLAMALYNAEMQATSANAQIPALVASVAGLAKAMANDETFDEAKLLASIEERVREGTKNGLMDAGAAMRAASEVTTPDEPQPV